MNSQGHLCTREEVVSFEKLVFAIIYNTTYIKIGDLLYFLQPHKYPHAQIAAKFSWTLSSGLSTACIYLFN